MTLFQRAPRECGSWYWPLDDAPRSGLAAALEVAASVSQVLLRHRLLRLSTITTNWLVRPPDHTGAGSAGWVHVGPTLNASELEALHTTIIGLRPATLEPDRADPLSINLVGPGICLDADGTEHEVGGLVNVSIGSAPHDLSATLEVFHDVWMAHDFAGRPHEEIHRHNAPRLATALRELDDVLGVEGEPGEATYFGHAVPYGVENNTDDDGAPADTTDLL